MVLAMIPTMVFAATTMPAPVDGVIKLTEDVTLTETFTVNKGEKVTIDLNGYTISMTKTETITANHEMILNNGTLIIEDSSADQKGKITYNYTGADTATDAYGTGGKASNTITNNPGGRLIINGGTIENLTVNKGTTTIQIAYVLDSRTNGNGGDAYLEINGGKIVGKKGTGVRVFGNSTTCKNELVVTGGVFETGVQLMDANKNKNLMDAEISGGEFSSTGYALYVYGNGDASGINVDVSGGTFHDDVYLTSVSTTAPFEAEISGGEFEGNTWSCTWDDNNNYTDVPAVTGGTFATDVSSITAFDDTKKLEEKEDGTFEVVCVHKNTELKSKEATCSEEGYKDAEVCKDCGETVKAGTVVKATGNHEYKDGACKVCGAPEPVVEVGKLPTVDTTKPVEKVEVGTTEATKEVLAETSKEIVDAIIKGEEVNNVPEEVVVAIQNALEQGMEVEVSTRIDVEVIDENDVEELVGKTTIELIEKTADGDKVVQYLDLSVEMTISADGLVRVVSDVSKLSEEVTFTIAIPEELQDVKEGYAREFYVIRVHDGETEILEVTVNDDGTLSFKTDRFSVYALAYTDTAIEEETPTDKPEDKPSSDVPADKPEDKPSIETTETEAPKTGDTNTMMPWIAIMAVAAAGAVVFKKKENELNN